MILAVVSIICGCNDKAPSCSTLSWGETNIEESGFNLKYSAGNQCENINDYYDVSSNDIKRVANSIVQLKLSLTSKCKQVDYENGEEVEVECPEYVPETIEFGEINGCKFDTPPSENNDCLAGGLTIYTSSSSEYFEKIGWSFWPPEKINENTIPESFSSFREDDTSMVGTLSNDSSALIEFTEEEYTETGKNTKSFVLTYTLEIKE
jgi:hypothetical protein